MIPAQLLSQGQGSVIRAVIASLGGGGWGGREQGLWADPEGRYIYLGNESPNTVALLGGLGTRPSVLRDTLVPWQRSPRAAH